MNSSTIFQIKMCSRSRRQTKQLYVHYYLHRKMFCVRHSTRQHLIRFCKYPNRRFYRSGEYDVPKTVWGWTDLRKFENVYILKIIPTLYNTIVRCKIRPFIDLLNDQFRNHCDLYENLAIDESMGLTMESIMQNNIFMVSWYDLVTRTGVLCSSTGYMYGFEKNNLVLEVM